MSYTVVWFKRDLRVEDHMPLAYAARRGEVLCLYVIEPELWQQPDCSSQHYFFVQESVRELVQELRVTGVELQILIGHPVDVFTQIHRLRPFDELVSHQETGNAYTYSRDQAVANWCRQNQVRWTEFAQNGVVRALKNRDEWAGRSAAHMERPCVARPVSGSIRGIQTHQPSVNWPTPQELGMQRIDPPARQTGGRSAGLQILRSFLSERSEHYSAGISSPLKASNTCSRISPYLAYGCLSMREVVQATLAQLQEISEREEAGLRWRQIGLSAFMSRLHWHCHFIQKLETEPGIEFENMHRAYDGIREHEWNQQYFEALTEGRTGWPMVDASIMMLRHTGWINFRMRAMLVSVATHTLWLHWRPVGLWLARHFLDYEPGIHWSQMQMQAGTTGINTVRMYNPIKQARDHDPDGHFVRRWLPFMRRVPDAWLFEPWRMPLSMQRERAVLSGGNIPFPLTDLDLANRLAKNRLYSIRHSAEARVMAGQIVHKHASRSGRSGKLLHAAKDHRQQGFDF